MSSQLGLGVMIRQLFGDSESAPAFQSAIGKTIQAAGIDDDANRGDGALRLTFTDGTGLLLFDDGRSCCESRYMRTDDDLNYHVGATLVSADVQDGPPIDEEYGDHETAFLHVTTSKGTFVVVTHNEHNGSYGGFWLVARGDSEDED